MCDKTSQKYLFHPIFANKLGRLMNEYPILIKIFALLWCYKLQ